MLDMHSRPSELMGIQDEYTAFCFDEACAFIIAQLQEDKKPVIGNKDNAQSKTYTKPSDLYRKYQ